MAFKNKEEERAYQKAWYIANLKRERAKRAAYYHSHKEEARVYDNTHREERRKSRLEWQRAHPGYKKEYNSKYYASHREEMIASAAEWNRQHPEKVAAKSKAQHAKRKGNGGSYTAKQWLQLKKTYGRCVGCGLSEAAIIALGRTLAADHVLPIAKGGSSNIDNIQPLCHGRGGCNNKKAARHIDYRRTA